MQVSEGFTFRKPGVSVFQCIYFTKCVGYFLYDVEQILEFEDLAAVTADALKNQTQPQCGLPC